MTKRSVLLLTYHFAPSAASGTFRMLGFARHLPHFGWRVGVVAAPQLPWDPADPALLAQVPPETAYDAVPYPKAAPRLVRALLPNAVWLPFAWRACRRALRRERPDVVLTSGPPHLIHLLGLLVKRKEHLPWVADFRDPWVSGVARPPLTPGQHWLRYWERQVVWHADRVIANAPNATRLFRTTYPRQADKVVTLTNGFDPPAQALPAPVRTNTIRLLHAGEIYSGRDPRPLLDAMAALQQDSPIPGVTLRLEVMGAVYLGDANLHDEVARRGLTAQVQVQSQRPYQEALQEMARSDLLVLLDSPGRRIGVPAKLYEYLGARRPILALAEPEGDTAQVLRESGVVHRIAPPRDAGAIQAALAQLVRELDGPAIPDPQRLRRFTRASLAGDLAGILDEVRRHQPASGAD